MGGEFDGLAPVPVAKHQDRVVALPGDVKSRLGADPFRRTVLESPMYRRARVHLRDVEIHPADLLAGLISKSSGHRTSRTRRTGRVFGPPARHARDGRYGLDHLRDRCLDADPVNDVHHDLVLLSRPFDSVSPRFSRCAAVPPPLPLTHGIEQRRVTSVTGFPWAR